jgi:hypothetical protein
MKDIKAQIQQKEDFIGLFLKTKSQTTQIKMPGF